MLFLVTYHTRGQADLSLSFRSCPHSAVVITLALNGMCARSRWIKSRCSCHDFSPKRQFIKSNTRKVAKRDFFFFFFFLRNRQTQLEISMRTLKLERKEQTVFIFIYLSSTYFYSDMYINYFTDSSRKMTKKQNTQILNGSKYCIVWSPFHCKIMLLHMNTMHILVYFA